MPNLKLGWGGWLYSLFAAVIGGAANTVAAMVVDPVAFNVNDLPKLGKLAAASAVISAALFLKQSPLPPVKAGVSLLLLALLPGCAMEIGSRGFRYGNLTPPKNAVVHARVSSVGITVGQNQATQTPELNIGYKSATYDRIPTAVGEQINAPEVKTTMGVNAGLDASIKESLTVGSRPEPAPAPTKTPNQSGQAASAVYRTP